MAEVLLRGARIAGLWGIVPRERIVFHGQPGATPAATARLREVVGLEERRVAAPEVTALDLGERAARELLGRFAGSSGAVGAVVFVTQTPDYFQPGNAVQLQARLGLPTGTLAFDVALGCSGYVYGLYLAQLLATTGEAGRVLLVVADTLARTVHPDDASTVPLFGDGAAATLVEAAPAAPPIAFVLGSDGRGQNHLCLPGGAYRHPPALAALPSAPAASAAPGPLANSGAGWPDQAGATAPPATGSEATEKDADTGPARFRPPPAYLWMDGAEVFAFSLARAPAALRQACAVVGLAGGPGELHRAFLHQANCYLVREVARRADLSATGVAPSDSFRHFGNTSSASIPLALAWAATSEGSPPAGAPVGLLGFGVGWSWGAAVLRWSPLPVLGWSEA